MNTDVSRRIGPNPVQSTVEMKKLLLLTCCILVAVGCFSFEAPAQTRVNVRFKPGTAMGQYNGAIRGERYLDYIIRARASQTLRVQLLQKSGAPAYFNVQRNNSPEAIAGDARETTSWRGQLSENGVYIVRVYMAKADRLNRKTSTYRIEFNVDAN